MAINVAFPHIELDHHAAEMNISPVIRVVVSNALLGATLAAVWFGYGPLPLFVYFPVYVYLHRLLKPRIPEFTKRGHPLPVRVIWYLLIISLAAIYFAGDSGLLPRSFLQIYVFVVVPILFVGCFFDDIRYARKLASS